MKIAIIHDWLVTIGGAERVLKELLALYPQADVYSTVCFLSDEDKRFLGLSTVHTTFIQRLPRAKQWYQKYLPLMPIAIEQLDLSSYDLVISSSYAVAKGVITGPDQLHVSYTHTPIRYAWDLQHLYLREAKLTSGAKSMVARVLLHYMRLWDVRTAHGVDKIVTNSAFIARRVKKCYGREATVIYPPVNIDAFCPGPDSRRDTFYLTASRMVPYKRMPLIVEAFAKMPGKQLVVIGDGPDMAAIQAKAGPNVKIMGRQSDAVLRDHMRRARAFLFAAEEDFGITPLEAQACGTPVIAYGRGGTLETVRDLGRPSPTGVYFHSQTGQDIVAAVERFERNSHLITAQACRANAVRFSPERFRDAFSALVEEELMQRCRTEASLVHEEETSLLQMQVDDALV